MIFCFHMNSVLDALDASPGNARAFVEISAGPSGTGSQPDDLFLLPHAIPLFDLTGENAAKKLAEILNATPLYRINAELALDAALTERHENTTLAKALAFAFAGHMLPHTLNRDTARLSEEAGELRHPMLGHVDHASLARIYTGFINALGPGRSDFGFGKDILGQHPSAFLDFYEGYIHENVGAANAQSLLRHGTRKGYTPARPDGGYVERGHFKAQAMTFSDHSELFWAWMEADAIQASHCKLIDRYMRLPKRHEKVEWVNADVFSVLEHEAMKQYFAELLIRSNQATKMLEELPLVRKSVFANAAGQIDANLQLLLSQILDPETAYLGAADNFASDALRRCAEARKIAA